MATAMPCEADTGKHNDQTESTEFVPRSPEKKFVATSPTKARNDELENAVDRIITAQHEAPKKVGRRFKPTRPPPSISIDAKTEIMTAHAFSPPEAIAASDSNRPAVVFQLGTPTSRDAHFIGTPVSKKALLAEEIAERPTDKADDVAVTLNNQQWPSDLVIQSQSAKEPTIRDLLPSDDLCEESLCPSSTSVSQTTKEEVRDLQSQPSHSDDHSETIAMAVTPEAATLERLESPAVSANLDAPKEEVQQKEPTAAASQAAVEKKEPPAASAEVTLPMENCPTGSKMTRGSEKLSHQPTKRTENHIRKCKVVEDGFRLACSLEDKGSLKEAEAQFRRTLVICSTLLGERPQSAHRSMRELRSRTSNALERLRSSN